MERTLSTGRPAAILPSRAGVWTRLLPLWRHATVLAVVGALVGVGAWSRLEVQRLRTDLDRASRTILEAHVLHDRLGLELEARRRVAAMEVAAATLGLGPQARLEGLGGVP